MSRKVNPWDNAACESFMKTLKYEEVYRNEYRHLAKARASIGPFLEKIYNQKRLHSAMGYVPPAELEAQLAAGKAWRPLRGSFPKEFSEAWEIYRSDVRRRNAGDRTCPAPRFIGLDEFQSAIPWRVGLHQSPPPLRQLGSECNKLISPVELSLNCLSHLRARAHWILLFRR
jgi:hypothetical protein